VRSPAYCALLRHRCRRALLAQAVAEQGRHEESLELSRLSATIAARDDLASQVFWRTARANVLIARANLAEAHRLAAEAVAITADTDFLLCRATAALTLGQVLAAAHRFDEATGALTAALEGFEAKGDVVSTRRARIALDRLPQPA
jgi:tetratricopeptide (TPR) repeat protein